MSSEAGEGFLAGGGFLTQPVPDGEGLHRDLESLTKSEAEGVPLSTSFLFFQSVRNRWSSPEPERRLCAAAPQLLAVRAWLCRLPSRSLRASSITWGRAAVPQGNSEGRVSAQNRKPSQSVNQGQYYYLQTKILGF